MGLVHYLSTSGGKSAYANPCLSGVLVCESCEWVTDLHHGTYAPYIGLACTPSSDQLTLLNCVDYVVTDMHRNADKLT